MPDAYAFAGLQGCGKTAGTTVVRNSHALFGHETTKFYEMSDVVRSMYHAEHEDGVDDNGLGDWAASLKDEHGDGHFAEEMATMAADDDIETPVFAGLRSPAEAHAIQNRFNDLVIITPWATPSERFRRKHGTLPSAGHPAMEEFLDRRERELHEWGCLDYYDPEVGLSTYIVPNNGPKERYIRTLEDIVAAETDGERHDLADSDPFLPHYDREDIAQVV